MDVVGHTDLPELDLCWVIHGRDVAGERFELDLEGRPEEARKRGGSKALVKKPEIPLAWPSYVAVSDRWAYVADTINRRVVRVKLAYAAEMTCAAP